MCCIYVISLKREYLYKMIEVFKCKIAGGDVVFQCRDEGPLRAQVEWIRGEQLPLPPGSKDINGRLEMPNIQVIHMNYFKLLT